MSASQLQRLLVTATAVALAGCGASQTGEVDTTVWQAVERGDVAAVAKNLGGPSLANSTNTAGNSVARLLLAKGADANQRNQFGRTPLHRAADEDRLEVVRLLLAKGADVNARDCRGSTPLIAAAEFASLPVLELLVEAGADVATGNHYGRSALHNAAKREDPAVTKFMIAHGARLNQVCEYGTPLDLTANSGIADVLRAAGGSESATKSIASRTHQKYLTKLPSTE